MSTFDATTPSAGAHSADNTDPHGHLPAYADLTTNYDEPGRSTLDELRAAADEVDTREPITVTNPRDTIRLTLRTDLTQREIQSWSTRALSPQERSRLKRRGGNPNLSGLDAVVMFATAIVASTLQVEVRSRATNTWAVVTDEHTGDPLTFNDPALRKVLGGIDAVSAVKRAFNNSEPALLEAGGRLLDASGFGDDDPTGDSEDPTTAAG